MTRLTGQNDARQENHWSMWRNVDHQCKAVNSHYGAGVYLRLTIELRANKQVYEYFISHHLAKSFESLFGSITCLPGCFSMYRLRTPDSHKPLFVSNQIVHDYAENRVDTLHLKNLLHLGEDRYLTTLVLKHFPTYKTKFVRDAHAQTVAPDSASVLLSQRRRWINSTVHNLAELVFLDQLCGFCCFSMRFVVFIDLLSTIVAPVTVAYVSDPTHTSGPCLSNRSVI
jgi:chitin synthase